MRRRPPSAPSTDTLFPYTTLVRSIGRPSRPPTGHACRNRHDPARRTEPVARPAPPALCAAAPGAPFPVAARFRGRGAAPPAPPHLRVCGRLGRRPPGRARQPQCVFPRSEEHTSELQSLMRTSYAVFCLKKKKTQIKKTNANLDTTQIQPLYKQK